MASKTQKDLQREFNHGHCVSQNIFLATAVVSTEILVAIGANGKAILQQQQQKLTYMHLKLSLVTLLKWLILINSTHSSSLFLF